MHLRQLAQSTIFRLYIDSSHSLPSQESWLHLRAAQRREIVRFRAVLLAVVASQFQSRIKPSVVV